jgi:methylthioribose-1-phosphate isomerase
MTHCNAGALATAGYGTALGVIRGAIAASKTIRVLACETRPSGRAPDPRARTGRDRWEIITDNGRPLPLPRRRRGRGSGPTRIAANGDTAKIGTYSLGPRPGERRPLLRRRPDDDIDLDCPDGSAIRSKSAAPGKS